MGEAIVCPRCGRPVKSVHVFTVNGIVYYRFYHGGGVRCYVGPREYRYATRTQWRTITIFGAMELDREERYIRGSVMAIREMSRGSIDNAL